MRAVLNSVIYFKFFFIFSPRVLEIQFGFGCGRAAEVPSCFLPVENLNFPSKLSIIVLLLQTLQRHFLLLLLFTLLTVPCNIPVLLRECLLFEYVFFTAAAHLSALSSNLSGNLSHPELPSPKLLLHSQMVLPLSTIIPPLW